MRRKRLLSDREALLAFCLCLGAWFVFDGLATFEAATPAPEGSGLPPHAVRFVASGGGTNGTDGNSSLRWVEQEEAWPEPTVGEGQVARAAFGLLEAGGGVALASYGVFRWSSAAAGDWLPPGRYAQPGDEADEADETGGEEE